MLQCPVDGTELRISQKNGVEIDYCPRCRGVWLDRGELEKLISQSLADEQARYGDLYAAGGAPKRKNEEYYSEPPREVRRNQRPYEYDDDDLEYNNRDRDRGYYPSDRDSDHHKKHKKKSLLEDIFDIFGD